MLTDVSVAIGQGEIVALIGRSGSGKSTVLRVLAGLSNDHTGERTVAGAPALAFQEPRLFPWRDVRTNVVYGLNRSKLSQRRGDGAGGSGAWRTSAWPTAPTSGRRRCRAVRRNGFRLPGRWSPSPNCCCSTSRSARLDALTRLTMRGLLLDLWREHGFGVLLVTHDVDEAVALADRVLVLEDGTRGAHPDDRRTRASRRARRPPKPSITAPSCSTSSASGSDKTL